MYCLPATLRIPAHPASTPCGAVVFYRFVCHWYWHSFMLNERSNMQKLVRRSDLARSAPPWSTSGAGALATAPVLHDDDQGSQVVRNKDVAVSQSQGGGAVFMPSVFFCFRTQNLARASDMGRKRKKHRTHVEEESLVRGRVNWRGVRPGRCTMHARHFHAPALHPRPPESIAGAVLAEHTGAVRMPKDAWLGPSNSDSL